VIKHQTTISSRIEDEDEDENKNEEDDEYREHLYKITFFTRRHVWFSINQPCRLRYSVCIHFILT
jgi:hypothetical protein